MLISLDIAKKAKKSKISKIGIEPTRISRIEQYDDQTCLIEYDNREYIVCAQFNNLLLQANGFQLQMVKN